jgi:hypothetical protein
VIYLLTDSEYTTWPGALESGWAEPWQHREIFQMGAILTDDAFNEIDSLIQLVRPTLNIRFDRTLTTTELEFVSLG